MNAHNPTGAKLEADDLTPGAKIALEFFSIAKAEVVARIRVRDTLLATYAAAAFTAIATILASQRLGEHFLYGIPYLSLAFSLLVSYHHAGIGALGNHCATDLLPRLAREGRVLAFEYSSVFHQYHKKNSSRRVVAHAMILLLPSAIALLINWSDLLPSQYTLAPQFAVSWIVGLLLMVLSYAVIHRSNRTHYQGFERKGGGFPSTRLLAEIDTSGDA